MRMRTLAALAGTILLLAAAPTAKTPEQIWRESLAEANLDWSKKPHAILKIHSTSGG